MAKPVGMYILGSSSTHTRADTTCTMKLPYKEGMTQDLRSNTALPQNPVAATTTLSVQRISFLSSRNQETVSIPVVLSQC